LEVGSSLWNIEKEKNKQGEKRKFIVHAKRKITTILQIEKKMMFKMKKTQNNKKLSKGTYT
jgi:hypothetical protein